MRRVFVNLLVPFVLGLLMAVPGHTSSLRAEPRPTAYVDPFIGTDGTGHTFPGPGMPFGMVQPGPDNADSGWAFTSGYQYRAPLILGFSQTRASGTGIPELGDVLLQPSQTRRTEFASPYDKASEVATPGYYAVYLGDNQVRVELTAGVRTALHRYTFDAPGRVYVLVDLQHGLTFRTDAQPVLAERSGLTADGVEGVMRRSNWTSRTVAFSVRFDHPVVESTTLPPRPGDAAPRYLLAFDLGAGRELNARVGLSTVDVEGARASRDAVSGRDFDGVRRGAVAAWDDLLGRIEIAADNTRKRIFYTALYHAFLHPSTISDVDGRWRGPHGEVLRADGGDRDSTLSLWSLFDRFGYYPFDLAGGEAVSRTLEAGIGDDATARMAAGLARSDLAGRFSSRAGAWRSLVDPETRLARGRDSTGGWREPFDPLTPTSPLNNPGDYTEANAWQYSWTSALHDPDGLVEAMGGPTGFRTMLDRFFFELPSLEGWTYLGQEAMIGQYAHGNEPSHHIAWLYAHTDAPERGHQLVARIARDFYRDTPDGIIGNEDAGQLSAWYVFATLGFYPVTPASGTYVAGLPLVDHAVQRVPGREPLTIRRTGAGDRLLNLTLDGRPQAPTSLPHSHLVQGGALLFEAGREP